MRPRIVPSDQSFKAGSGVFDIGVGETLRVEGIDFINESPVTWFVGGGKLWEFHRCRIVSLNAESQTGIHFEGTRLRLKDCLLIVTCVHAGLQIQGSQPQQLELVNSVIFQKHWRPVYQSPPGAAAEFEHTLEAKPNGVRKAGWTGAKVVTAHPTVYRAAACAGITLSGLRSIRQLLERSLRRSLARHRSTRVRRL